MSELLPRNAQFAIPDDPESSTYRYILVAAKRARQINDYHPQLGEGSFEGFAPPLIESRSKNFLTMALEEIAEGKLKVSTSDKNA